MTELTQDGNSEQVENTEEVSQEDVQEQTEQVLKVDDAFWSQFGDGVNKVVSKQVDKAVNQALEEISAGSQGTVDKSPEEEGEPEKVQNQAGLEKVKEPQEENEVDTLRQRLVELEGNQLEKEIRNIPQLNQLAQRDASTAERFVKRALSIATSTNVKSNEVNSIFADESDIAVDLKNQLAVLENTQVEPVINKPTKEVAGNAEVKKENNWGKVSQHFYNQQ